MTQPRSNSRRFVNAAWSLLTFQLIASAGAVGVTALAAFHVRDLIEDGQQAAAPAPEAAVVQESPAPADAATAEPSAPIRGEVALVAPVNDGPGTLTLNMDGQGNIIASLSDPDGLSNRIRIEWLRNGNVIAGASGPIYAYTREDWGQSISARAQYIDADGFEERAVSASMPVQVLTP